MGRSKGDTFVVFLFPPHLTKKDGDENLKDQGVALILLSSTHQLHTTVFHHYPTAKCAFVPFQDRIRHDHMHVVVHTQRTTTQASPSDLVVRASRKQRDWP